MHSLCTVCDKTSGWLGPGGDWILFGSSWLGPGGNWVWFGSSWLGPSGD